MNHPLVSLIIPTYNRAHLIGETLDSVLAQTYTNWECIVVDDGSTDQTNEVMAAYVAKDSRIQYHQRPDTHLPGGNGARNYGFKMSKGDYIQWFDSDDLMLPNFISLKLAFFTNNIAFVICEGTLVNSILEKVSTLMIKEENYIFKDYLQWNLQVITNSLMFSKCFLNDRPLFNEELTKGQETEFFSRLFFNLDKQSYVVVKEKLFLYRYHENSKTTQYATYNKSFKESLAFICVENFKRSIELKDNDLISQNYKQIIKLFYKSYKYNHKKIRFYLSNEITSVFFKSWKYWDIIIIVKIMTVVGLDSFSLYKYLKNRNVSL